jgi:S1-C subfamily serine protease
MEDIKIIEAVERYLNGEMSEEEKSWFGQLRASNPEVDQMVVEQSFFLSQLKTYGNQKQFRHSLDEVHSALLEKGEIAESQTPTKVVSIFKKYGKILVAAASIAGIIAVVTSGLIAYFGPRQDQSQVQLLANKVNSIEKQQHILSKQLVNTPKAPLNMPVKANGTGFLVDGKGYLVTNAHVIKADNKVAKTIIVQNNKGQEFKVTVAKVDDLRDLAILKIDDSDFKSIGSLPYNFKKYNADLGEPVFTMGFPRNEIVYGEGYLSARTGFNGDTLSCQMAIAANPGNSGGPVFNRNGEVIGILTMRQVHQGFVFAVTTKNILYCLDDLKKDTAYRQLKIASGTALKGMERTQQIKRIEDYVYLVKTY